MRFPLRMQSVQTPIIPVVADLIRQYPGTISLGQGVVSYGPPPSAIESIQAFLADSENHKYKPVQGLPALVDALERKLEVENGITVQPASRVVVTAGGNMAFMNAVLAITDPGDEVILQSPYYFNHEMAITLASCRPVLVPTDANYQLQPDVIRAAITPRTRAVVTISPNNPTGAVYPENALRAVNELCREGGIYHIHDEAYEYFLYDGVKYFSPGSLPEAGGHTVSLFSFSKAYGFASWRVGYMVLPTPLLEAVRKIQDTILICAPVISQFAALGALRAGANYCHTGLKDLTEVRSIALRELHTLGDRCLVPPAEGAFYFLLKLRTALDPMAITERLVREHGVAVIPGTAFGFEEDCYLRISYGALPRETAIAGIERLVKGLEEILT
jgi:aspartate/methionine/tyrosine aminotransferase